MGEEEEEGEEEGDVMAMELVAIVGLPGMRNVADSVTWGLLTEAYREMVYINT